MNFYNFVAFQRKFFFWFWWLTYLTLNESFSRLSLIFLIFQQWTNILIFPLGIFEFGIFNLFLQFSGILIRKPRFPEIVLFSMTSHWIKFYKIIKSLFQIFSRISTIKIPKVEKNIIFNFITISAALRK